MIRSELIMRVPLIINISKFIQRETHSSEMIIGVNLVMINRNIIMRVTRIMIWSELIMLVPLIMIINKIIMRVPLPL